MSNRGLSPPNTRTIRQEQPYECTFLVWRNRSGLGTLTHPGHAVLLLRRTVDEGPWEMDKMVDEGQTTNTTITPAYNDHQTRYVSFWPGGDRSKYRSRSGDFLQHHLLDYVRELGENSQNLLSRIGEPNAPPITPRSGQIVIGTQFTISGNSGRSQDIWGQMPEARVPLPGLYSARADKLGLNLNEIVRWTNTFSRTPDCQYSFVSTSQNCAAVAVRAMNAGVAAIFAELGGYPEQHILYITPQEAETYAGIAANGIRLVNHMLGIIRGFCVNAAPVMNGTDLMSAAAFKNQSAVNWKIRGAMLRNIDSALAKYERLNWAHHYLEKLKAFVDIISNTASHIRASQSGSRDVAFKALGVRILEVVRQLAVRGDQPWAAESYYGDHALVGVKR